MSNKMYKLLKDLPWVKENSVFKHDGGICTGDFYYCGPVRITREFVESNPDMFQPIEDRIDEAEYWKKEFYAASARLHKWIDETAEKKYSQEQYDKAIEDAFNAARTYIPKYKDEKAKEPSLFSLYETYQDYLNHLYKQTKP